LIFTRAAVRFIVPCVQHAGAGDACYLYMFFPHLAELVVDEVTGQEGWVLVAARTQSAPAACRGCGMFSSRVHGRYRRLLHDLPVGAVLS
jgi:hypothetical protein